MEKKELKLKKEVLSNLTNLNIREIEELKGGVAALQQMDAPEATVSIILTVSVTNSSASYTVSASVSITL